MSSSYPPISTYPHHPHLPQAPGNGSQSTHHTPSGPHTPHPPHQPAHQLALVQNYSYNADQHQQMMPHQQQQMHPAMSYHNGPNNGQDGGMQQGGGMQQQNNASPPSASGSTVDGEVPKANRLRRACDSCSSRKVKCDSTTPCKPCRDLNIPCTFSRPSKRRGPVNRHAEEIHKRVRQGNTPVSGLTDYSSLASPNNAAVALASMSSQHPSPVGLEAICPFPIAQLLIQDFFTYIHPLCPFPHQESYLHAFKDRADHHDPKFLALTASMIGALVSSFPRKPFLRLKANSMSHVYRTYGELYQRCRMVATQARGSNYLIDGELNSTDAATSYFLGLSEAYTMNWQPTKMYFGETLNILRVMSSHKAHTGTDSQIVVDHIEVEMHRRIFYVMLVGVRCLYQLNTAFSHLIFPPPTPNEPYPPLPQEVDDDHVYIDSVLPQPQGRVSKLVGFNLNVKIYETLTPVATMELVHGIDRLFDYDHQLKVLTECLDKVKHVLDNAPVELSLNSRQSPQAHSNYPVSGTQDQGSNGYNSGLPRPGSTSTGSQIQYEIQKANILVSQLATRSYLVEKLWMLQEAQIQKDRSGLDRESEDAMSKAIRARDISALQDSLAAERESIVKELLVVIGSFRQVDMEPNGGSFITKIRSIASTLESTGNERKGPVELENAMALHKFIEIMTTLEHGVLPIREGDSLRAEEAELRAWSDMKELQMRFLQGGGFFNE